jgi:sugar (pentulose or hexulose) kinase
VRTQEIFEPGMANHQRYAQLYTVYASLYESLREHFYKVDAIPES